MSEKVIDLNDSNFHNETQSGVALIDFWAPWCGPCRMQGPIIDQVAEKVAGKATVAKLNVDESPSTAASLCQLDSHAGPPKGRSIRKAVCGRTR